MADIRDLADHWQDFPYSYESRDELPDGDEVWVWDTLNLGLPVLWLKHPNNTFDCKVIHTPGYDAPSGEHWCFDCHTLMERHGSEWVCRKCGIEVDDRDIDAYAGPTEEASYNDELDPEPEWYV